MIPTPLTVLQDSTALIISTSIVSLLSGFFLGVYSIRGYLISPTLADERRHNLTDPFESDESDVDDDNFLDHAPNWANGEEADRRDGLRIDRKAEEEKERKKKEAEEKKEAARKTSISAVDNSEECKLVLVVRTDLGMTKGKIAAQCSHATLACYKKISSKAITNPTSPEAALLRRWERQGQAKIAVQCKSQDEIMELMGMARSLGITSECIHDAGRTQIEAGSLTVLGVGPAPKSLVNQVTGNLKLL
ncbi:peptidyl-tRNA hydrolase PTH2-domain-containing protein [Zalerion maritima]|uniref:peptidyl-tRNA hydrolase n=1 Tax=Zalerion maritima TaxID=339359 RepID=A0AAD5RJK2_9PEZI|nr:peptidyl-tRNA hydrolase PTH2-domain-containing protein [Zalerion maritima]